MDMSFRDFLVGAAGFIMDVSRSANENYIEQKEREVRRKGGFDSEEEYNEYERQRRIYDKRVDNTYKEYDRLSDKIDSLVEKKSKCLFNLEDENLTEEERIYYKRELHEIEQELSRYSDKMTKVTDDVIAYEKKSRSGY